MYMFKICCQNNYVSIPNLCFFDLVHRTINLRRRCKTACCTQLDVFYVTTSRRHRPARPFICVRALLHPGLRHHGELSHYFTLF